MLECRVPSTPGCGENYPAGHVRVSEIWVPFRRDPPKIIAHHAILIERASCPQRPRDCNYDGKADHASEADQHDVDIISLEPVPTDPEKRPPSIPTCRQGFVIENAAQVRRISLLDVPTTES